MARQWNYEDGIPLSPTSEFWKSTGIQPKTKHPVNDQYFYPTVNNLTPLYSLDFNIGVYFMIDSEINLFNDYYGKNFRE